jgi:hypothetical protein
MAFQIYGLRKVKALTPKKPSQKKVKGTKATSQQAIEASSSEAVETGVEDTDGLLPTDSHGESSFRVKPVDGVMFEPLMDLLYKICTRIDPVCFPPVSGEAIEPSERFEILPEQEASGSQAVPAAPKKTTLPPTLHKPSPELVREMTQVFKQNLPEDIIARYDLDEERLANDLARCFKKASVEYITSLKGRPDNGLIRRMQKRLAKRSLVKQERKDKRVVKKQIKVELAEQAALDLAEADRILQENPSSAPVELEPSTPQSEKKLKKQKAKEEKLLKKAEKGMRKKGKFPALD